MIITTNLPKQFSVHITKLYSNFKDKKLRIKNYLFQERRLFNTFNGKA